MTSYAVRLLQLVTGLTACAVGIVMTLRSGLGVSPWDVLHGGVAERTGIAFGTVVQLVGLVVLALGVLLGGVRPGLGTFANIALIGTVENVLLDAGWLAGLDERGLVIRSAVLLAGVAVIGFGAALYIGAHLGAGPRDSLMVALHVRSGRSVGLARTVVEIVALVVGLLLGGPFGVGTVLYAVGIGAAVQLWFRVLRQTPARLPETTGEPL
ncbi:MAG TPA: hypothetical protein VNA12_00485 [Mycobacteriales bacterium]|nr:hypothetical protein [Mycobacteriales bacterium]